MRGVFLVALRTHGGQSILDATRDSVLAEAKIRGAERDVLSRIGQEQLVFRVLEDGIDSTR